MFGYGQKNAVFEGLHTPRSALRLFHNRRIIILPTKKSLKICICAKFVVPLQPFWKMNEFLEKEEAILRMLKTVYDPEIPVNVYDLGLVYGIELKPDGVCEITMTLTAPSCPAGDFIVEDIRQKVGSVEGIKDVNVTIVFEPEWTKDMMSEEAKLELGFL